MPDDDNLNAEDYAFLIGMAADLVETVLESDRLHVAYPAAVRLYDDRMGLTCAALQGQRLNVGYGEDGMVSTVWVG